MVKEFVMHMNTDLRYHSGTDATRKEALKTMLKIGKEEGRSLWGNNGSVSPKNVYYAARRLVVVDHDPSNTRAAAEQDTTFM